MRKILLLLVFISSFLYSQKIKIKNNILFIEKNEVCRFEKEDNTHYKLSNLEGDLVFNLAFLSEQIETMEGTKTFKYLVFSRPKSKDKYYSDYDISGLKISFNGQKTIVRHLLEKNHFLNENSINYDKINTFFSQLQPKSTLAAEKAKEFEQAYATISDFNLAFDNNKIIRKAKPEDIYIGKYKISMKTQGKQQIPVLKVYDAKNFLTVTYEQENILFFDGNSAKYSLGVERLTPEQAKKIITRMVIYGYTLGDMQETKHQAMQNKKAKQVAIEKQYYNNIYNERATIYDNMGTKMAEGIATLEFEEMKSKQSGMTSIQNYGGVVTLQTTDSKGKKKYKDYKAKEGLRVCIESTGRCYQGIKTGGLSAPKFNEEVKVLENVGLYKSQYNYYIIKKINQQKGLIVRTKELFKGDVSDKILNNILQYLNDCPKLKEKINFSEVDLDKEEDLIHIVTTYSNCN